MKFSEVVAQTLAWLERDGRISYRALKREFEIDDEYLDDLKAEIIKAKRLASDEDGEVLVWTGAADKQESENRGAGESASRQATALADSRTERRNDSGLDAAERRQITVLFCDLVGSTALSTQLDPEDYRAVVQAYQATAVIEQHQGHLAQHWGDGLLVYFSYPTAHEDDARRAVRTGLEISEAVQKIGLPPVRGERKKPKGLQVRIGVHTGLVVIGEIGGGEKRELLALGETPNLAARIQSLAEPNTVLMSAATQRLVDQQFESQPFGSHLVKGFDKPITVYHVQSERQPVSPLTRKATLTPLVGREQEIGLLLDRWEQVQEGRGQVVLLSGEPGIGKSRLALTLKEHVTNEGSILYEALCSPYRQQSALYPLIDSLQRTFVFTRQDTDEEKAAKLERGLALYDMQENLPLFTDLLSLPPPSQYPPLNITPQKQKELTFQALLQLLTTQAERQATVSVWEDLHWADPSSLEFLNLLIEQIPTSKLLLVLTFRPEFSPPWKPHSHIFQLVLNRLGKTQVEAMIEKAAAGKNLPADVIDQIRLKTDGVPLFVEEVTKSVVESVEAKNLLPHQLAVPATLQEALLARLDRLTDARQVAQLCATLGREFSYELLYAVSPFNEANLQSTLTKLVEAEILYQRGVGEQTRYFFKHALIQDTAYQSLLKSTRQQYHQQIAEVLEEQFPDIKTNQTELLAHHYTEAGLIERAIPYWQQAGERATQHSAHVEAINHITKGLELLKTLPDTAARAQQELTLLLSLGIPLILAKGYSAPEAEIVYVRARELCQQVGHSSQLFSVLWGLWLFYLIRADLRAASDLAKELLDLAQNTQDQDFLLEAHFAKGCTVHFLGELPSARFHFEQLLALYDSDKHRSHAFLYGQDPGEASLCRAACILWLLGYPDLALQRSDEALILAQELAQPIGLTWAHSYTAYLHQFRREAQAAQKRAEAAITLATTHEFPLWLGWSTVPLGWALAAQGREKEGIIQLQQGWATFQATGAEWGRPHFLALLAEAQGRQGRFEDGLTMLTEALATADRTEERWWEAESHRLKGELLLQQARQAIESSGH